MRKGLVESEAETNCSRAIARAKRLVRARDEGAVSSSCARPTPNGLTLVGQTGLWVMTGLRVKLRV